MSKDFTGLEYIKMNMSELEELDREKTIFLISVSPIEAHGPHLPLGTDIIIAEELQRRYIEELKKEFPDYATVKLPPLYAGADALPAAGSISVAAPVLKDLLIAYGEGLAKQGFRYLFISDNHGGPRHQLGIEVAAQRLWKKYKFYLVDPFNTVFRMMIQHDEEFMERLGLEPGCMGDDADAHAGTNETSLMMASEPGLIAENYKEVPPSAPPSAGGPVNFMAKITKPFSETLSKDLYHLTNVLAWVNDPDMKPYMGAPAKATKEAGEIMLSNRVEIAMTLFRQALNNQPIKPNPMLWKMKFLYRLPE